MDIIRDADGTTKISSKPQRLRCGRITTAAIGVGTAVLLLAGAGVPSASAVSGSHPVKIRFVSVTKKSLRVPTGGADIDVDRNTAGKAIGSDTLNCRGTTESNIRCAFTVDLPGGDLLGSVTPTKDGGTGRVLAGTRKYAGMTGTIKAKDLTELETRLLITVHG